MAPRKTRKDKGTKRELTVLAEKLEKLAAEIRDYDQRDRLKADKEK
jgi:hypothetical protein